MAFELNGRILKATLEKMGAVAKYSLDRDHYLIVNSKYEICYTNYYYRKAGSDKTLGQGRQEFLKLVEEEMNLQK